MRYVCGIAAYVCRCCCASYFGNVKTEKGKKITRKKITLVSRNDESRLVSDIIINSNGDPNKHKKTEIDGDDQKDCCEPVVES